MLRKLLFKNEKVYSNFYTSIRNITAVAKSKEDLLRMKAWQVHSYGEELQCCCIRYPIITQPTQLLVEVNAASVNPIDIAMQNGYGQTFLNLLRNQNPILPLTLGRDFCGTVIDKGHSVSKYKIGDKVYGMIPFNYDGSHAETTVVEQSNVCHVPENIESHIDAASIPYAAMTAYSALWIFGGLAIQDVKGKKILILGASGGVGNYAVQMLKAKNAVVYGSCSTNAMPLIEKLNADYVFDYTDKDYIENVRSHGTYDIILDCAKHGYENLPSSWQYCSYITLNSPLLQDTDKYGLIGGLASCASQIIPQNIKAIPQGRLVKWAYVVPCEQGINFINDLVKNNQLKPTIDSVFSFDNASKAYEKVKSGHLRGKVVINMLANCDNVQK